MSEQFGYQPKDSNGPVPPVDMVRRPGMSKSNLFLLAVVLAMAAFAVILVIRDAAGGGKSSVNWRTSYADGKAESDRTGKPMMIDFTAAWCPPCQQMKKRVWTDVKVGSAVNGGFIPVLVDVDANPDVAQQYSVRSIPTLIIQRGDNILYSNAGYHSASAVLDLLRDNAGK